MVLSALLVYFQTVFKRFLNGFYGTFFISYLLSQNGLFSPFLFFKLVLNSP